MCGESPQGMFSTFSLLPAREQFLSGCGPHFSFVLAKEKWRPQRWKRKPFRDELTGTDCRLGLQIRWRLYCTLALKECVPAIKVRQQFVLQIGHSLCLFSLAKL